MKTHILPALLALAAVLLLSGCSLLSNRSYYAVTTHVEQRVSEDDPSVLRAETYQELVSAILHFVAEGAETGTVRLYQYTGDVESDLNGACKEVLEGDLLGVYALHSISHDYSRIVSYYECTFDFSYRHTADEIASISTATTAVSLREQLRQAMDDFLPTIAFRTSLRTTEEQVRDIVEQYYAETPQLALGRPGIQVNDFEGTDSSQRIIEVRFLYTLSTGQAQAQRDYVISAIDQIIYGCGSAREDLWLAYQALSSQRQVEAKGSDSIYEYLYNNSGSDEAAAMAALLLCQRLGLEAQLVQGADWEGQAHTWLVVCVEENWCHLDPAMENTEENFLRSDREMAEMYSWDTDSIPACTGLPMDVEEEKPVQEENTISPSEVESLLNQSPLGTR